MGVVIPFPEKKTFIEQYSSHLPPEVVKCISLVYDKVIEKANNLETLEINVSNLSKDQVYQII